MATTRPQSTSTPKRLHSKSTRFTSRTVSYFFIKLAGAQVYIHLRDFERAVEDCDRAITLNPNWTKAYLRKAVAHSQQYLSIENILQIKNTVESGIKLLNSDTDAALIAEFNDVLAYIKEEERIESFVPITDPRRTILNEFEEWFKSQGGVAPNTVIRFVSPTERGLFASRDIKMGETVVFCPESIVFNEEKGKQTDFGKLCVADTKIAEDRLRPIDYIMFNFLEQIAIGQADSTKCKWIPYFRALPQNFDNLGSNFTDDEVNMAQGTNFVSIKEDLRLLQHNQYYLLVGLAKSYNINHPFNQIGTETAVKIIESRGRYSKYTKKHQTSGRISTE